jgi:hypothetical protein
MREEGFAQDLNPWAMGSFEKWLRDSFSTKTLKVSEELNSKASPPQV